jgi:hypothetical protein
MPIEISGTRFHTSGEAAHVAGVTRQTLWRWRSQNLVPTGRHYRGKTVIYTDEEVSAIVEFSHRVEAIEGNTSGQLNLHL